MEKITINGRDFEYKVFSGTDEYGRYYETDFYQGVTIETHKKYIFFGPEITKEVPNKVFSFEGNIESNSLTKEELRKILEKKVKLLDRQAEIDRGELI